ncbi:MULTISPECIES: ABC transporter permease [Cetobacterium]|jgi:putative spermidine/putrescine transport system permease protein|uniref:ABC transporter permease subunit n=1 Tax=Candidatus Cetobacterium colombiensis TaxID=3073100 RepID=A0ABU4WC67_9FUSO|nr:ABC transporter permease subunit [Candidatus Cetobacterium colombiensis]MDX8336622.1 ABC transporter permease subunit [Candidatus Cetobacterium colombiensis]
MKNKVHMWIVTAILTTLFLPILGTLVYSLSTKWTNTLLPQGLTLKWYLEIFKNEMFLNAVGKSFWICLVSLFFIALILVPAVFVATYYFKKIEKFMEILVLVCFAVPGAVSVVGLIKLYSSEPFRLVGTTYILVGVYFVLAYPFVYRGIKNSLDGLNLKELIESANILGASTRMAFFKIIVPNISKGLSVSMLLTFSMLFGEFLLVNMLVGGKFQTVQMYINSIKSGYSGHYSSALVITYFAILLILTTLAFYMGEKNNRR